VDLLALQNAARLTAVVRFAGRPLEARDGDDLLNHGARLPPVRLVSNSYGQIGANADLQIGGLAVARVLNLLNPA